MFRVLPLLLATVSLLFTGTAHASELISSPIFPPFNAEDALQEEGLSAEDIKDMEKGKVIVRSRPKPDDYSGTHVMAAGIVPTDAETIFSVLMDCENQPSFVPKLAECRNSYDEGVDPALANEYDQYQKLIFKFAFISKEITFTNRMFAIRPHVSGWVLKEGDIDASEGYWRVIPHGKKRSILVYDVYNNPGMAVPEFIQSALVKGDLPGTVEAFRKRAVSIFQEKEAAAKLAADLKALEESE